MIKLLWLFIFGIFSFSSSCPGGSFPSPTDSALCYQPFSKKLIQHSAEIFCVWELKGQLISVHNDIENRALLLHAKNNITRYWIGSWKNGDNYLNIDGSPFDYQNFSQLLTNNSNTCVYISLANNTYGAWGLEACNQPLAFYCSFISKSFTIPALETKSSTLSLSTIILTETTSPMNSTTINATTDTITPKNKNITKWLIVGGIALGIIILIVILTICLIYMKFNSQSQVIFIMLVYNGSKTTENNYTTNT